MLRTAPAVATDTKKTDQRTADTLVQALAHFGVDATIVGQISGPRVTRYELQLAPGTKVSKVAALKDDLSYALATTEIRILAPIPGKQAVGVEVPNIAPQIVTLGDIYDDLPSSASPLAVWLGKDISGNGGLVRPRADAAPPDRGHDRLGQVGLHQHDSHLDPPAATPDEVRMILIDPKRIELSYYESIPHLLTPVVSNPKEASASSPTSSRRWSAATRGSRIVRARNLPEANRALRARGEQPMPYLLVVIDELADLMMVSPQAVEDAVIRLAQKSRAVGIHLVLATQRPSVDVITGMIKANVPSRIAFAVSARRTPRDPRHGRRREPARPGRHALQAARHLAPPARAGRVRLGGRGHARRRAVPRTSASRSSTRRSSWRRRGRRRRGRARRRFDPDEDPLLDKAIEIVVQTQTASVSLIQRRLRVGYTRAGRLIDMLERRGIISGYEGSKPRRVLVDEAELERFVSAAG